MKLVESYQIVWRAKKARGPDVEMVFPLPIAVAIESKHSVADAYDNVGQVVGYALSRKYDAVFLRLEVPPKEGDEDFKKLKSVIGAHGIGVVVGESTYSPLIEPQMVLQRASLRLRSNPLELIRDMGFLAQSLKASFDELSSLRKCFCGERL